MLKPKYKARCLSQGELIYKWWGKHKDKNDTGEVNYSRSNRNNRKHFSKGVSLNWLTGKEAYGDHLGVIGENIKTRTKLWNVLKSKTQQPQDRDSLSIHGSVWRGLVSLNENKKTFWANEQILREKMVGDP